ncbi:hypothetical protein [Tindallia californiensis]|uniref:Nicotianamine synthase protein n=1 Tax=Tindallia californiensis TaxID=159292 RepID=A0A1H3J522_9FIRM|nr:hypothetical protein [Tindallia californiensis]SDY35002.1 Nicotianamine synthase protein [Tindallia californiensis]
MIPQATRLLEIALSHSTFSYPLFQYYYEKIVRDEIKIGGIKRQDRVLCIGGGAFPATAIEIHRQTGAKVDVLDCDQEAVQHASDLLQRMGKNKDINVYVGCGQSFDPKNYQVVHIALQVKNREEVLAHLQKNTHPGTKILARFPRAWMEKFYDRSYGKYSNEMLTSNKKLLLNPRKTIKGTCMVVCGGKEYESDSKGNSDNHWKPVGIATYLADGYSFCDRRI